jgi:large subunit ribosomal protein L35
MSTGGRPSGPEPPDGSSAVKKKTKKAAAKRFSLTGRGRVRRRKAFKSHILTKKTAKRKRGLRKATIAAHADERRITGLLTA